MKHLIIFMTALAISTASASNPFLVEFNTVRGTIPFNDIKIEHFMPAFEAAIAEHRAEVEAIANNPATPSYQNTISALERSGRMLSRVSLAFFNLLHAETNDELDALAQQISPMLTEHSNSINLNQQLFERVKFVFNQKNELNLNAEQAMLLNRTYRNFVRNGANLNATERDEFRQISKDLNLLSLQFSQNVLRATNDFSKHITDANVLDGLPDFVLEMLAEEAKKAGKEEGYLISLRATSYTPVMRYASNRDLRRELFIAQATRAMGGEFDNSQILIDIVNRRLQMASLLGFRNYAEFALQNRMAENIPNVYNLLNQLLEAYRPAADAELAALQDYANRNGADFQLQIWDWSYYAERLRTEKINLNDEMLKPYFELESSIQAVFDLTTRLFGITYKRSSEIHLYHHEVIAYEVFDENGEFLSVLYMDFHPRDGKSPGAWMSTFKDQWIDENYYNSRPQVVIVMNFTRPTATTPALLTFNEFVVFLHEFGHAIHGMLAQGTYASLSGTSVYRDFVELPSHLLENWAWEKEFLDTFAKHFQTGERMSAELMQRVRDAQNFNIGYATLRQLGFGFLDMAWHTIEEPFEGTVEDIIAFEQAAMEPARVLPLVPNTTMSPTFSHIFAGGYAAGYYSYKWAEVLVADAFELFLENGIFDQATARSFKENILKRGGSEHPMVLYKRFRGQEPTIDALLRLTGIKDK